MTSKTWISVIGVLLVTGSLVKAQMLETEIVQGSLEVLDELTRAPDRGIPSRLLREAQGVAIFPHTIKAGFIIGGRHGRGMVVVRREDGTWSHPVFLVLTGGSVGFQAGAQSTDVVLVFRTRRGIDQILAGRGRLNLGGDISIAAGPVGRETGASTDITLRSEVLSYSRSRGLFAGAALSGASIRVDWSANQIFYASDELTPSMIINGTNVPTRESTQRFLERMHALAPPPPPVEQAPPAANAAPPAGEQKQAAGN